ncbi:hypothetical protein RZS08_53955, partial [Arthrospira platensis SPKY1]|nr:hypothetical protein [Arthrospira platensis SPKY1]
GVTLSESGNTITIAAQGTDDQVIDTFGLVGKVIRLSVENDGEPFKSIDLSPILDTLDNQGLTWNAATQQITISKSEVTIDLTEGLEDMVADMFLNGTHTNASF